MESSLPITIHVSQAFLPGGGGLEQSIDEVARFIDEKKIAKGEIICLTRDRENDEAFDKTYPIPIYRSRGISTKYLEKFTGNFNQVTGGTIKTSFKSSISMWIFALTSVFVLSRLIIKRIIIHRKSVVVLHVYSLSTLGLATIMKIIFWRLDIRIIFSNQFTYKSTGSKPIDFLIKKILKSATCIVCVSKTSANSLMKDFDLSGLKILIYSNWIDLKALDKDVPRLYKNKNKQPLNLLFVGRIVPEKGIDEIIQLAEFIEHSQTYNRYKITVIGSSNHPIKKKLLIKSKKLSSLQYLDRIEKPSLWKYFSRSDIFLMPVKCEEGFGRVLIEAYAFGLPVIGSNRGAIPEVISNFSIYKIIESLKPEVILRSIEDLSFKINEYGKDQIRSDARHVIREKFSKNNLQTYQSAYKLVAKEIPDSSLGKGHV